MPHWTECLDADAPDGAYLSWRKVEPRVGISRMTAWRLQKAGDFPRPYVVSPGRVAYRESEVEAWRASRSHRTSEAVGPVRRRPARRPPADAAPAALPQAPPAHRAPDAPCETGVTARRGRPRARDRKAADQINFDF